MKNKIFKSEFSDMKVMITNGFITLQDEYGATITIGNYPNARTKLIEEAFEYSKSKK